MAKTRSQVSSLAVKKEEQEEKPNVEQLLHSTNNASKTRSKITKNRNSIQALNAEAKSENENDTKAFLLLPKKILRRPKITTEQIAKLIGYVVNDKMNVAAAARKVGLNYSTALNYYHEYQDNPEHKIPLPKSHINKLSSVVTQQKVENLISYIVHDKMTLTQAAKKLDLNRATAEKYYSKYRHDPERKIPLLTDHAVNSSKICTQEEIANLVGYIVNDKMSLVEASMKVNMSHQTARRYYLKYLQNPNHEIPNPFESNQRRGTPCTNDQISSLIGYIVNDGMSVLEASIKVKVGITAASKYYRQYLEDPESNISTPETSNRRVSYNTSTVDQVKNFFCYVIIDKLNVAQAARKAKITSSSAYRYYTKYVENSIQKTNITDTAYSAEKMKRFVELVQNEKMSLTKAADIVHLSTTTARKHYQHYLKDPQYKFPVIKIKQRTQEDIRKLIDYIRNDKMSIKSAAKRVNMTDTIAQRYYKEYRNDPEHKIPVPKIKGHAKKNKTLDKYAKIIAEIYKNNPSIKPLHENHDIPNIKVKEELEEEDTKMALKK